MSQSDQPTVRQPLPHSMRDRKPWPMWPIGLAILLFVVIYTYINIAYRKEGRAYEPFQAMLDRQNAPVEKNFYDWWGLKSEPSGDAELPVGTIFAPGEATEQSLEDLLPLQLQYYIASRPILVPGLVDVESAPSIQPGVPLRLTLSLPSALAEHPDLVLLAFYKEGEFILLPTLFVSKLEDIAEALATPKVPQAFEIPTSPFEPGQVRATLISEGALTRWDLPVHLP